VCARALRGLTCCVHRSGGVATGASNVVVSGMTNSVSGAFSTIISGFNNKIVSPTSYASVQTPRNISAGGAQVDAGVVVSGRNHVVGGQYAVAVSGQNGVIGVDATEALILDGTGNTVSGGLGNVSGLVRVFARERRVDRRS
jgi:hypothetical protein